MISETLVTLIIDFKEHWIDYVLQHTALFYCYYTFVLTLYIKLEFFIGIRAYLKNEQRTKNENSGCPS